MKLSLSALLALVPGTALAHPGAHLHPHGQELVWLAALAATLLIAGVVIARR